MGLIVQRADDHRKTHNRRTHEDVTGRAIYGFEIIVRHGKSSMNPGSVVEKESQHSRGKCWRAHYVFLDVSVFSATPSIQVGV